MVACRGPVLRLAVAVVVALHGTGVHVAGYRGEEFDDGSLAVDAVDLAHRAPCGGEGSASRPSPAPSPTPAVDVPTPAPAPAVDVPTPAPAPAVDASADYESYPNTNAYGGHGGIDIDTDRTAPSGLSEEECKTRCSEDAKCSCVTFRRSSGKCWKRANCDNCDFSSPYGNGYDVFMKKGDVHKCPPGKFDWIQEISRGQGGKYVLEARTYYIDKQYQLPPNTEIIGAGSGESGTIVKAHGSVPRKICRGDARNRKGFLLGDNTYIGKLHFVGIDDKRMCDNQLLCGGAPFETPGCAGTGYYRDAPKWCDGDLGIGRGVNNATVEDVTIADMTVQSAFYANPTKAGVPVSTNIVVRKLRTGGCWADGMNIHGAHKHILVEDCDIRNTGDDTYAIWSINPGADNITFNRCAAANPWYRRGCRSGKGNYNSNYCFAVYGGKSSRFLSSTCTGARNVVAFGNLMHKLYGGTFYDDSSSEVRGVRGMTNNICYYSNKWRGRKIACTASS